MKIFMKYPGWPPFVDIEKLVLPGEYSWLIYTIKTMEHIALGIRYLFSKHTHQKRKAGRTSAQVQSNKWPGDGAHVVYLKKKQQKKIKCKEKTGREKYRKISLGL